MSTCHATYREWAPAGWEPPDPEQDQRESYERLADSERWSRRALDARDRLVATISWEQFKNSESGAAAAVAHVSAVFVDPARWREGIATVLLSHAEEAMRERGYELARLWTPERAPARRFYEARGWRHDGRRMWHDRFCPPPCRLREAADATTPRWSRVIARRAPPPRRERKQGTRRRPCPNARFLVDTLCPAAFSRQCARCRTSAGSSESGAALAPTRAAEELGAEVQRQPCHDRARIPQLTARACSFGCSGVRGVRLLLVLASSP